MSKLGEVDFAQQLKTVPTAIGNKTLVRIIE